MNGALVTRSDVMRVAEELSNQYNASCDGKYKGEFERRLHLAQSKRLAEAAPG
jgi:hypothetical protein